GVDLGGEARPILQRRQQVAELRVDDDVVQRDHRSPLSCSIRRSASPWSGSGGIMARMTRAAGQPWSCTSLISITRSKSLRRRIFSISFVLTFWFAISAHLHR